MSHISASSQDDVLKDQSNRLRDQSNQLRDQYDISDRYGFLTDPAKIPQELPPGFEEYKPIVDVIDNPDGNYFRNLVNKLKQGKPQEYYIALANSLSDAQKLQIYTIFTFIAQKYVRCMGAIKPIPLNLQLYDLICWLFNAPVSQREKQIQEIPYEIGLIWNECSKPFKLPCVTAYSAVILNNFRLKPGCVIGTETLNLDDIIPVYAISDTYAELHFYKLHMAIEALGHKIIKSMYFIGDQIKSKENMIALLKEIRTTVRQIHIVLIRMYSKCRPEVFWKCVRIYLGGYTKDNGLPDGLKVTGTNISFKFGGGSAAQSTLIQAIDIFFNIDQAKHGETFLKNQRDYMPFKHRQFLKDLAQIHSGDLIRNTVISYNDQEVTDEYNKAVDALKEFRRSHYNLVHNYIDKFVDKSKANVNAMAELEKNNVHGSKGSGGLPTEKLKDFIDETEDTKIGEQYVTQKQWRQFYKFLRVAQWWLWRISTISLFVGCMLFYYFVNETMHNSFWSNSF